ELPRRRIRRIVNCWLAHHSFSADQISKPSADKSCYAQRHVHFLRAETSVNSEKHLSQRFLRRVIRQCRRRERKRQEIAEMSLGPCREWTAAEQFQLLCLTRGNQRHLVSVALLKKIRK